MERIKAIIEEHPQMLRTPITDNGGNPLHLACNPGQLSLWAAKTNDKSRSLLPPNTCQENIVKLLLDLESEVGAKLEGLPCYNMKDDNGDTPVFQDNTSTRVVEFHLKMDDLAITSAKGLAIIDVRVSMMAY